MNPAEQARTFAGALLGDHGGMLDGLQVTLSTFSSGAPEPQTRWFPATADSLASAVTEATARAGTMGVYVGVGLTRGLRAINPATGKQYKRLAKADVDGLAWLWVDIDVVGVAHGHRMPLCPDKATAIAVVNSLGIPPTIIVDTGHGIQAHWRLREPWIYGCVDYDDDGVPVIDESKVAADRKAGEDLAWSWIKSFQVRAKAKGGWHVDPTTDPCRLVRCPGSYNRKVEGDHRLVTVIEVDTTARYDLDEIHAVLMPETLLAPYRYDHDTLTGALAGVDLGALWNEARSFADHTPPWMAAVFEINAAPDLEALWNGERDADYSSDDSAIDMALARMLLTWRVEPDQVAQAIMCRRLRRCAPGEKIDKVDPGRRTNYLVPTIGKIVADIQRVEDVEAQRAQAMDRMVAADTKPAPIVLQAAPDPAADLPPEAQPEDPGGQPEAPTNVGGQLATSNENAVTLAVESTECKETAVSLHCPPDNSSSPDNLPSLRAVPRLSGPDPAVEYADAPRTPRQGIDDSIPGTFTEAEKAAHLRLGAALGLPPQVMVWAVGERRLAGEDEIRVWFRREDTDVVRGGRWRPHTVASTRWHPKSEWDGPRVVAAFLRHDLHLFTVVPNRWGHTDNPNGVALLYELARWMPAGTPEDVATLAILGLLRKATGTTLFSTARTTRDPWVATSEEVWVPWINVGDAIRQLGHKVPAATVLADTLGELRCKVRSPMEVTEGELVLHDAEQWVRIPEELTGPELWTQVAMRAADRDVADRRNDVRMITS